ncbi:MAG: TRAP transporter substrate-binding protein [Alphaproteobacteria bacterium]|nr:TRAP transporter substrate-binding protein [Alphaproteobacteria bacterium]
MRRLVRRAAVTAVAATLGLAAAADPAAAQDRLRWGVPIAFGSNLTALGDTLPWVAQALNKSSGGRITFQVFEPGALIPALGVFDAASEGKIEAGYSWMGYEIGKVPASALIGATPFGLEPQEFMAWMYFGGGDKMVKDLYAPHNVVPIFCGTISPEAAGWFRFELKNVDQLKGLKFRAAGLGGKIFSKVGASVTLLPGGELFQALERGVLDGTEFSLPTVDEQLGFFKVAKFYYLPGWHQPSTNQFLYVNKRIWDGLKDDTKALIETTCTAGVAMSLAKAEALQGPVMEKFAKEGVKLIRLPEQVLRAFRKATDEVMAEESAKDANFKNVHDAIRAFQASHRPWKELGYLPRDWK